MALLWQCAVCSIVVCNDDNLLRNCADLQFGIESLDSESHRDRTAHGSLKTTFGCPWSELRQLVLVVFSKPRHYW